MLVVSVGFNLISFLRVSLVSNPESEHAPLSFANEGQFLLVSAASFDAIREAHARVLRSEPNPAEFDDDGTCCLSLVANPVPPYLGVFVLVCSVGLSQALTCCVAMVLISHTFSVISIDRFRPNIVVAGRRLAPFAEDSWSRLSIVSSASRQSDSGPCDPTLAPLTSASDSAFLSSSSSSALAPCEFVVEGPCTRCAMVNVDQRTGARRSLLFKTLATCRRGQNPQRAVPRSAVALASTSAASTSTAANSSQPMAAVAAAAATAESNQSSPVSSAAAVPSGRITFGALLALRPSASTTSAAAAARAMQFLRVGDTVLPSSI